MRVHHPLLTAAVALLCSAAVRGQSTEYRFEIDPNGGPLSWELILSLGNVDENPPQIHFAGELLMELSSPTAPFGTAELHGSLIRSLPTTVVGTIPNPLPLLPPLGSFTVHDLQAEIHSVAPFTIAPNGDFSTYAFMNTSAGAVTLSGIFGSGSVPLAGMFQVSNPTAVPVLGNLSQNGSDIDLHVDLDVTLAMITPTPFITGSITLNGPLDAQASTTQADPLCVIVPYPLPAGTTSPVEVRNATPTLPVYLAASLAGLGNFTVGSLGVTLGIASPMLAAPAAVADATGTAQFTVNAPASMVGRSVWVQALQIGEASNVAGTWIE